MAEFVTSSELVLSYDVPPRPAKGHRLFHIVLWLQKLTVRAYLKITACFMRTVEVWCYILMRPFGITLPRISLQAVE